MKTKFLIGFLIVGLVLISGCIDRGPPAMVKIVNAKLESGSLVLSLESNQTVENVRIELVDENGQVLCTKYKDLVGGVTEFELRDCEIKKMVTVSVSPPEGRMTTKDFRFELPSVRIKDARFEQGKIILTLDADEATDNVRVDIIDESDTTLCSKYKDLVKGITDIELTDCEIKERITVSVSPPKAEMITGDFTLVLPEVRIKDARSELGKIIVILDANMDISDTRIHVFDRGGEVLCSKHEDLPNGLSELELKGCQIQEEITVSVSPPMGKTTTRDFTQELPLFKLKEGMRYRYTDLRKDTSKELDLDVYVTKETDSEWQGIIGSKETQDGNKKAQLFRFKINKKELNLLTTYSLDGDEVLSEDIAYTSAAEVGSGGAEVIFFPFILSMLREANHLDINHFIESGSGKLSGSSPGQMSLSEPLLYGNWLAYEVTFKPESETQQDVKFFVSAAKPYLLINLSLPDGGIILEKVEEKSFDLSDYEGYEIEVKEIMQLDLFCEPDGVAGVKIKNIGRNPIYTADIEVAQKTPKGASVSAVWDKDVIQPGEASAFRDQCEGSGERDCTYRLTSPRGTTIHPEIHCEK